jgi:hypothetical protein
VNVAVGGALVGATPEPEPVADTAGAADDVATTIPELDARAGVASLPASWPHPSKRATPERSEARRAPAILGLYQARIADVDFRPWRSLCQPRPRRLHVLVNRAFFFFIRDVATNTVLLVEREGAPTAP